ncbi:acyl-CoA dehydrogenase family protein [Actinophytocola sp.]|uniref:acyl-CoA dehydrogenase family protein n=1 Tax=Actinophytocola sp. TaxID=1872138 RepID=UPI003D6B7EE1
MSEQKSGQMSGAFHPPPEHEEFRGVLRKLTESRVPLGCAPAPAAADAGDRELWQTLAGELGLAGLVVPERHGGGGFGRPELAIAAEELGRAVAGGPLFASAVLATEALLATGPDATAAEVLPGLAAGERVAALAVVERSRRWQPDGIETTVGERARLRGVKEAVLGAAEADVLVVAARGPDGLSLFLVEPGQGVAVEAREVLDPSRSIARVVLTDAPARPVGRAGEGWPAVERALEAGAVFLAAEQVGGSQALLDAATEHAGTRVQFGRPVGQFQGVKHRLADMAVRTELGRAAATWAAWQEPGSGPARLGAAVARAHCAQAYLQTALDAIQVHGGMAITWEHHAHRFLRRARADLDVLPGPAEQRRLLESMIGTGV